MLSKGLKFIPMPHTDANHTRKQLLCDFEGYARRMRLQYMYHGMTRQIHPFYVRSNWKPPVQPSVTLETYLEETKLRLAEIRVMQPKQNLQCDERKAFRTLRENKEINIKKADKGTTTVIMRKTDKITEGQTQLNVREHYQPLETPMVEQTSSLKVKRLISELYREQKIDDMTFKWLSLTPNPPRMPVFYTLKKIYKTIPAARPIISGCEGPTERISSFVDSLLQPIMKIGDSYLRDTTDFINFIERTKVSESTILVSMDVTSLYTNIPQEEGITVVCEAYDSFHKKNPAIPTNYLREMLRLILKENSFQFLGKTISRHTAQQWALRWQFPLLTFLCLPLRRK